MEVVVVIFKHLLSKKRGKKKRTTDLFREDIVTSDPVLEVEEQVMVLLQLRHHNGVGTLKMV